MLNFRVDLRLMTEFPTSCEYPNFVYLAFELGKIKAKIYFFNFSICNKSV